MKKIIAAIFVSLLALSLQAEVVTTKSVKSSTGEGHGITREEAVNNAIIKAIGKMSGVRIKSLKSSQTHAHSDNSGTNISDYYSQQISKATQGRADTYEIISADQEGSGWVAVVKITNTSVSKKYKAPGLDAKSRRSITVFQMPSPYPQIAASMQQKIITKLLNSRKFNVLDRDSQGYYDMEKAILQSGDQGADEALKLKNVLGTDYMLLFHVKGIDNASKKSNLTGRTTNKTEVVVDYRVLLFATRQIKFSNTLAMSIKNVQDGIIGNENAIEQIAAKISGDVLNAIYPLIIAEFTGADAVFSQMLVEGDIYDCFSVGKAVKDAYTGEAIGNIENKVGTVQVNRVTPKVSYAAVTEGAPKKGDVCRLVGAGAIDAQGGEADYSLGDKGGVKLGF